MALLVCAIGVVGSLGIGFGGLGWSLMSAQHALIFPLVIGPYAVLAALTAWRRSNPGETGLFFGCSLLASAVGCWGFGRSLIHRFQDSAGEMAMDMAPLTVPMLQWGLIILLGIVLSVTAAIRSMKHRRRAV